MRVNMFAALRWLSGDFRPATGYQSSVRNGEAGSPSLL